MSYQVTTKGSLLFLYVVYYLTTAIDSLFSVK